MLCSAVDGFVTATACAPPMRQRPSAHWMASNRRPPVCSLHIASPCRNVLRKCGRLSYTGLTTRLAMTTTPHIKVRVDWQCHVCGKRMFGPARCDNSCRTDLSVFECSGYALGLYRPMTSARIDAVISDQRFNDRVYLDTPMDLQEERGSHRGLLPRFRFPRRRPLNTGDDGCVTSGLPGAPADVGCGRMSRVNE
jgi:hypothetical protein